RKHYVETSGDKDVMITSADQAIQRYSGYNQLNLMQKVRFKPNRWLDLTYGFHYSESSDVPRYDRLIQYSGNDTLKYADWYYGPQKWMMNVINGSVNVNCRMITELKFSLAWQRFSESRHSRGFGDPWRKNQYEDVDMYTANIDIEKKLNEANSIFYGVEGVNNNIVSTAEKLNFITGESKKTGTRYPDGSNDYNTLAAYVNYEHKFSEQLFLFGGIRYSYVKLTSTIGDTSLYHFPFNEIKVNTGALNGSLGMSWKPAESWQGRLNLSSGFRAPNLDDVGKVFDSSPGNVVVPNPGLKPEYAYNADIGLSKDFSGIAMLELTAFYTYLVDAMVRRDFTFNGQDSIMYDGQLSQVEAVVNAGSAWISGVSAVGSLNIGEYFQVRSSISFMRGEDDEGYAIRHVTPLFGNTSLIFKNGSYRVVLYANYNGEIPYSRLTPTERDKSYIYATDNNGNPYAPGWWTLNLKSTVRIIDQLSLDIGLENIFSKRYRPYSSGIVSPGRNFIIAVRASL
ncbi:MAG TPA: TonB-dependent receptor, partial [Bacteroidales bacterium]|nr:TonB-dependent receptor [Bacteroidales bacterium]